MLDTSRLLAGALALGALTFAGCGGDSTSATTTSDVAATTAATSAESTTTAKAEQAPDLAVIVIAYADYQQAQEKGIDKVVKAHGGSYQLFNAGYDAQKLLAQCKDAISSGRYNAILLQVIDPPTGVPCATAAKAAGIPVVALNTAIGTDPASIEPQVDGVVGGLYSSPKFDAEASVDLVKQACAGKDPCNIAAEIATPTDPLTNGPVEAVAQDVPNAKIVGKIATAYDPAQVSQKFPDILTANKDLDVFLSIADSNALAAIPALKAAGMETQVKIIGKGGSRAGAKAVADGTMFATTGQWPFREGEYLADMAVKAINQQAITPKGTTSDKMGQPDLLVKDNVAEFKPEWGAS